MERLISTEARNIAVSALSVFFLYAAAGPTLSIQNIVLADSNFGNATGNATGSGIDQEVGYAINIWRMVGLILSAFLFVPLYRLVGIKATYAIGLLLNVPHFASMIWIFNEFLLYFTALVAGGAQGIMWCGGTMATADNSTPKNLERNMGFFWSGYSVSMILGGVFNFIYMGDGKTISADNRIVIYVVSIGLVCSGAVVGIFGMVENKGSGKRDEDKEMDGNCKGDGSAEEIAVSTAGPNFRYYIHWIKKTVKRRAFWIICGVNIYWAIMWGFYTSILPTAIAAVFEDRNLPFVPTICVGVVFLVGTAFWPQFARLTNDTCNMLLIGVMLSVGTILAILIFPTDGAVNVDSTEATYITPQPYMVVVCASLLGFGDCGFSVTYYTIVGRIFADDTAMGYSVINFVFGVCYIGSMILPPLVNLHEFLYIQQATVVLCVVCVAGGLRKYLD